MRMADSNSSCISGIIRPGNCWQVEPLAHHVAYLLFASSPIPGHSQLHRTGSVLSDRDSPLRQHKNRNTARLRDCDCRCHILAEEEFLDGCLCWQVLGDDRAEPLIDLLQALGIGKCLRRQDRVAHKQTQIIALRCNNCIAQSAKARVNTQDTSHYSCTCLERQEGRPTTWFSELERSHVGLKFGSHLLETVDRQMISGTQIVLVIVLVNGAIS